MDLLGWQRVDVPDLPGHGHGVAVDHIEVLFAKQQQTLAGVQTLNPCTAVHVLNLQHRHQTAGEGKVSDGKTCVNKCTPSLS